MQVPHLLKKGKTNMFDSYILAIQFMEKSNFIRVVSDIMREEASDQNDSPDERDFAAEYEMLHSQSKEQNLKIEELTQELYCLKNRLAVSERIQVDYQSEIDAQQKQVLDANASNAVIILKLKEEHAIRVHDLESKIQVLDSELSELRQKRVLEKDELIKTRTELKEFQRASPVAALKAELQELMEAHEASRVACEQHQELYQILLREKSALSEELHNTREHLEMTEEKLKICKSDLIDQSETIEELRENLAVAQNELACLKSGPSDAVNRGNSLFAEVEDKRQDMLKKCSSLSRKYNEMKKDYGAKCAEISRLNMENLQLKRKWQEEAEERDNRDIWLKDNYEIRIRELLKAVEDLKHHEKPVFVNGDSKILTYAEELVEKSRKEIAQLRDEMEQRSSDRLNEAKALYMARSQVLSLKAEIMAVNAENLVLRDKLGEANIIDIPSPGKTLQRLKKTMLLSENCKDVSTQTHTVDKNDSFQKDIEYEIPLSSAATLVSSSCVSSLPKPKRLIKAEMMEKLQLSSDNNEVNEENGNLNHNADCSLPNPECLSDELEAADLLDHSAVMKEEQEETVEFVVPNLTKPIGLIRAEIKEQKIQFDGSLSTEKKSTADIVSSPGSKLSELGRGNLSEKVVAKTEKMPLVDEYTNIKSCDGGFLCTDELTFKETSTTASENIPPFPKLAAPRQSILTKAARPSLMPMDQNFNRKVRFADSLSSEFDSQDTGSSVKQSSPNKVVRAPKPKITRRIIVSKETEYQ
ncbi:Protein Spindly [Frankliniella fusca]|uniref:Protein Spindly n=1 Tax=Frankliniella fusca TaxID=407009 RepID=A0AAE1LEP5_9NEOP|nr:Protein Spindly [Frankliniella fusca]